MRSKFALLIIVFLLLAGCGGQGSQHQSSGLPKVLAVESFLADIARNVAGDRLAVNSLIPLGVDPHAYQPTPQDAAMVVDAGVLILNGANLESFLQPLLKNTVSKDQLVITASAGLTPLSDPAAGHPEVDPHFWLDPSKVITYVENIRDGLSKADPGGASVYSDNARKYIAALQGLDSWIADQVSRNIPPARRLLVTNHETFGYFAKRYGFTVVGAIVSGVSSGASPSARELAALVDQVRSTGAPAIFLETGSNPQIADQVAAETGVKVITGLYTHSLGAEGGPAATYIDMMKFDVTTIVDALK